MSHQVVGYIRVSSTGQNIARQLVDIQLDKEFVDTITVVSILSIFSIIPVGQFFIVIYGSLAFKILAALLDTPFCYLGHYFMRKIEFAHD